MPEFLALLLQLVLLLALAVLLLSCAVLRMARPAVPAVPAIPAAPAVPEEVLATAKEDEGEVLRLVTVTRFQEIARKTGATIGGRKDDIIKELLNEKVLVKRRTRQALAALHRWTGAPITPEACLTEIGARSWPLEAIQKCKSA